MQRDPGVIALNAYWCVCCHILPLFGINLIKLYVHTSSTEEHGAFVSQLVIILVIEARVVL